MVSEAISSTFERLSSFVSEKANLSEYFHDQTSSSVSYLFRLKSMFGIRKFKHKAFLHKCFLFNFKF